MNPSETIRLLPARARLAIYVGFAVLGALLTATQVGYAAAEMGQPLWLTVAWPVFGSLGTSFGVIASNNVTRDQPPTGGSESDTPTTFEAVNRVSLGQQIQRAVDRVSRAVIAVMLIVTGLTVTTAAVVPQPAAAGALCDAIKSCGQVTNRSDSKGSVVVSNSWNAKKKKLAGKTCVLSPGQTSANKCGKAFRDTDGVRIPKGLKGIIKLRNGKGGVKHRTLAAGDHKVRDFEHWTLYMVKA